MSTATLGTIRENPEADATGLIASPWHTLLVLVVDAANAFRSAWQAEHLRAGSGMGRPALYALIVFFELVMLAIVAAGVKLRGVPLRTIFGKRWESVGQVLWDAGLGILLLVLSTIVASMLGGHHGGDSQNARIAFLLPQTGLELGMWMVVSLVAGICEEAIYRGYVQRQFSALTRSAAVGIAISSLAFGAAHLYQGVARASVIAVAAVLFGCLAQWRKSVRPGMVAHTLQDAIAPLLMRAMRR